jgi:hypothetical protein
MGTRALWGANKEQRLAYRWFPKGAMAINHPEGLGIVYVSPYEAKHPGRRDSFQVVAYQGTAGKPTHNYRMASRESAEKWVSEWFESLTAHQAHVANRRAVDNAPSTLRVGEIITNSWGYDQTNVDCYQIVRATEHFVWLRAIAQEVEETGFMCGNVTPKPNQFVGDSEEKHKASGNSVTFKHGSGSKWDGVKTLRSSWYA